MSRADRVAARVLEALKAYGVNGTLVSVAGAYDRDTASVTETTVEHAISVSDLVDEAERYGDVLNSKNVSGTFYVAAQGLNATPKINDRITYQSRTFHVIEAAPYRMIGKLIAWRLDVSEVAS